MRCRIIERVCSVPRSLLLEEKEIS